MKWLLPWCKIIQTYFEAGVITFVQCDDRGGNWAGDYAYADMTDRIQNLLLMQGFCQRDIDGVPCVDRLARWTPLSCAVCGTVGLMIGNHWLAVVPAIIMIVLAGVAGLTQWCFASALYAGLGKLRK